MFFKPRVPIQIEFDERIQRYIVYLAHVQNSITLSIADKSDRLLEAEKISKDIFVSAERIKAKGVNNFNKAEVDSFLRHTLGRIQKTIDAQVKAIDATIVIDKQRIHSMSEAVETLTLTGPNRVVFSKDKIDRMFSFRCFYGMVRKPIDLGAETKKTMEADDKSFYELGLKAFQSMLISPGDVHPEAYFKAITMINAEPSNAPNANRQANEDTSGLRIEKKEGGIVASLRHTGTHIRVDCRINKDDGILGVHVAGFIEDGDGTIDFHIDQRYSESLYDSVLSAYRLKRLFNTSA